MDEKDFERIELMLSHFADRMEAKFETRFQQIDARFEQIDARFDTFKSEILREMDVRFEALSHEFKLLGDGVAYLTERVEAVEGRVERIDAKIDEVSLELSAHRLDTEAHQPRPGRVREEESEYRGLHAAESREAAERRRQWEESQRKRKAVDEEIKAYCAEKGVELPKTDFDEVMRQIRLNTARHKVEEELRKRAEAEKEKE